MSAPEVGQDDAVECQYKLAGLSLWIDQHNAHRGQETNPARVHGAHRPAAPGRAGGSGGCVVTPPVPDALRTQLAEVLAVWMARPSRPDDSQLGMADDASYDLWPYVEAALAAARAEGAAEALREAAGHRMNGSSGRRIGWLDEMADRYAAVLPAPTTTEGDPT